MRENEGEREKIVKCKADEVRELQRGGGEERKGRRGYGGVREGRQRGGKERELQHGGGEVREGERGPKVERGKGIDERRLE